MPKQQKPPTTNENQEQEQQQQQRRRRQVPIQFRSADPPIRRQPFKQGVNSKAHTSDVKNEAEQQPSTTSALEGAARAAEVEFKKLRIDHSAQLQEEITKLREEKALLQARIRQLEEEREERAIDEGVVGAVSSSPSPVRIYSCLLQASMRFLTRWELDTMPLVGSQFLSAVAEGDFPQLRVVSRFWRELPDKEDYYSSSEDEEEEEEEEDTTDEEENELEEKWNSKGDSDSEEESDAKEFCELESDQTSEGEQEGNEAVVPICGRLPTHPNSLCVPWKKNTALPPILRPFRSAYNHPTGEYIVDFRDEEMVDLLRRAPLLRALCSTLRQGVGTSNVNPVVQHFTSLWNGCALLLYFNWGAYGHRKDTLPVVSAKVLGKCAWLEIWRPNFPVWEEGPESLDSVLGLATHGCQRIEIECKLNVSFEEVLDYVFASTEDGRKRELVKLHMKEISPILTMPKNFMGGCVDDAIFENFSRGNGEDFSVARFKQMIEERLSAAIKSAPHPPVFELEIEFCAATKYAISGEWELIPSLPASQAASKVSTSGTIAGQQRSASPSSCKLIVVSEETTRNSEVTIKVNCF